MTRTPDREEAIRLIDEAVTAGARLKPVCTELEISVRSYQRWRRGGEALADQRPKAKRAEPKNKLGTEEREQIVARCNEKRFENLPPTQIVPALADEGVYIASESTFYRVLREADQLHRRGRAQPPKKVPKPKGHRAEGPNEVWSWDITYLATTVAGIWFRLYLVMDIYSRKIVGWEVHHTETAELAADLVRRTCLAQGVTRQGLVLHSDNGAPMKGATMLATLQRLGVAPSFSRPSVSDDNPFSESLFRTMKYTPGYPKKPFTDIEAARAWVLGFVTWYNEEHRHSAIRFVTPSQRHRGEDGEILARRAAVYAEAKARHPERWSGAARDWEPVGEVWLNPAKNGESGQNCMKRAA